MSMSLALLLTISTASPSPPKAKLVLIGLDGVSLNLLEPMAKQGVTPVLGDLMKRGSRLDLLSIWPLRTPQVWTTAVTGKLPGQHGIWDHVSSSAFNPPGVRTKEKKRVTSAQRRSKPLWALLDAQGKRTLTVGWMATWPAETLRHGVMVAPIELMGDRRQTTIKGSFYSDASNMVTPLAYERRVRGWIVDPRSISDGDLKGFAAIPPRGSALYGMPRLDRYVYALRWSLARAESVERITTELVSAYAPEVVFSYFQCTDSLLHRFWIFRKSADKIRERLRTHDLNVRHADELHRRFGKVVEACYRDIDRRVGNILKAAADENTYVLIISDHGFGNAPVPHRLKAEPYSGDHLEDGVLVAVGPGIKANAYIGEASVLDVTPTILHLLGQPVAKDMRGKIISKLLPTHAPNAKFIDTYEDEAQLTARYPDGFPTRKFPPRRRKGN